VNFSSGEGEVFEIAKMDKEIFETKSGCGASYFVADNPYRIYYILKLDGVRNSDECRQSRQSFGGSSRCYIEGQARV
jgi:hypothetical protein